MVNGKDDNELGNKGIANNNISFTYQFKELES